MKVWVAEVKYSYEPGYVLGVYKSEDAARLGVAEIIQKQGYPAIENVEFTEYEVEG